MSDGIIAQNNLSKVYGNGVDVKAQDRIKQDQPGD
jgi:hypothetical protein